MASSSEPPEVPAPPDSGGDLVESSLRRVRPDGPGASSLEQRLAIASILADASGESRTQLGRLTIQRRLGGGGMGVVYHAFDPDLGRAVAVKLLRGSVQRRQRHLIAGEARALAQVNHPNVVAVYEIVDRDDDLYFVMEYVPGVTLRQWLDARPTAGWREIVEWFVQAGRGLVAAHEKGIVHGDFKPENVLLGEDGRVRVADFGLAVIAAEDDADGPRGGTLLYAAPEVCAGLRATAQSDQFSYSRALVDALVRSGSDVPEAVRATIATGLREDATARHLRLGDLVAVLERALEAGLVRSRALLLERVERLWLRGVLERELASTGAVELALTSAPELVDPPWAAWDTGHAGPPPSATSTAIREVLRESHDALLVVGPPGAGKTILLLRLCRELFHASSSDPDAPAPVVLSLSTYDPREGRRAKSTGRHFAHWVADELVGKYGLPRPSVTRWLEERQVALLLDGLDEADPSRRAAIVEALDAFHGEQPSPMVVACRDSEYEAIGRRLRFGGAIRVEPLDDDRLLQLVASHAAPKLAARLTEDAELRETLRNPLLLTLYARSGDERASTPDGPSSGWSRAYEGFVDRAFEDASPDERPRLEAELRYVARAMQRLSASDLWLERLDFRWFETPWERRVGYALGVLAVFAVGLGVNLVSIAVGNPVSSALTFGIAVTLGSFVYTRGRIVPVESLRWSPRRAVRLLPITLACATAVGLVEALQFNFWKNMAGAWLTGGTLTLAFGLVASDHATHVRPNEGVRRSLAYALRVSLGFGLGTFLAFALVFEPFVLGPLRRVPEHAGNPQVVAPVAVALFVFTALFLIYGGFAAVMHGVLRVWLALRSPFGLRLEPPLGRAVSLGLLRQVGGGYVFLHRTLLDYFAGHGRPEVGRRDDGERR